MVKTNDPDRKSFMVGLEAQVLALFKLTPEELFTINAGLGDNVRQTLTLTSEIQDELTVEKIRHTLGGQAEASFKVMENGKKFLVTLAVKGDKELKTYGTVSLAINHPRIKHFDIPVFVDVGKKGSAKPN